MFFWINFLMLFIIYQQKQIQTNGVFLIVSGSGINMRDLFSFPFTRLIFLLFYFLFCFVIVIVIVSLYERILLIIDQWATKFCKGKFANNSRASRSPLKRGIDMISSFPPFQKNSSKIPLPMRHSLLEEFDNFM